MQLTDKDLHSIAEYRIGFVSILRKPINVGLLTLSIATVVASFILALIYVCDLDRDKAQWENDIECVQYIDSNGDVINVYQDYLEIGNDVYLLRDSYKESLTFKDGRMIISIVLMSCGMVLYFLFVLFLYILWKDEKCKMVKEWKDKEELKEIIYK